MELNKIFNSSRSVHASNIKTKTDIDKKTISENDEIRLKSLEIMKAKGIELSDEKIEAVQLALRGTTIEDAKKLNGILSKLCSQADKDLHKFKDIMAETLTKTTIALISNGLDLKLSKTKILNQYTKVSTSMGGYYDQKATNHKSYTEIFKGHFKDEDNRLECIINNLAELKTISKSDEQYLFSKLKDRYSDKLNDIIDDMNAFEFSELVCQAILGADGELTVTETIEIDRFTSDLKTFYKSSDVFHESIQFLLNQTSQDDEYYLLLKSKLKSYTFFRESSPFLKENISDVLNEMIQLTDKKDIEKLKETFKQLSGNHYSNSKYLEHRFMGPFNNKDMRPHQFENVADGILSLISSANMNIQFDSEVSDTKRYQRVSVWSNDLHSLYGCAPNPVSYSMILNQDEEHIITEHNKRIKGYALLNTSEEYYGNFMKGNDEMFLLDFQFRYLNSYNYIFNMRVSFFNTSPSLVSFTFVDNNLNVDIYGNESTIERLKSTSTQFENSIKSIGSHKLSSGNTYQNSKIKTNYYTVFSEQSTIESFQVTV